MTLALISPIVEGGWCKAVLTQDSDQTQRLEPTDCSSSTIERLKLVFKKGVNPGQLPSAAPAVLALEHVQEGVDLRVFISHQSTPVGQTIVPAHRSTAVVKLLGLNRVLEAGTTIHVQFVPRVA